MKKARAELFDCGNAARWPSRCADWLTTGWRPSRARRFHYCTMGFNAAARVAEVAGGRPFEDLVRDELLEPLGMKDTRYVAYRDAGAAGPARSCPSGESRFIMAGGGMTSTLDDFAAFYQMHSNGGTYRGRRILSEKSVAEMQTRQGQLDLMMAGPYGNHYGLAFFLDRLDDRRPRAHVITHPGFFGTNPWLDRDRELVGVLFVQSNFLRIIPTVRRLQEAVRAAVPAGKRALTRPPIGREPPDAARPMRIRVR